MQKAKYHPIYLPLYVTYEKMLYGAGLPPTVSVFDGTFFGVAYDITTLIKLGDTLVLIGGPIFADIG